MLFFKKLVVEGNIMITADLEYVEELYKYNFINNCEYARNVTLELCLQRYFDKEIIKSLIKNEMKRLKEIIKRFKEEKMTELEYKGSFIANNEYLEKIDNLKKDDLDFILLICANWQLCCGDIESDIIVRKFNDLQIFEGKNSGMYFQIWDCKNFAYYIAGQCMQTYSEYGFIPFFIQKLIVEWFRLYGDEKSLLGKYINEN